MSKQLTKTELVMTKPQKRVAAKVLRETGYSSREIERWLGISDTAALAASKVATPDELAQFEAEFKIAVQQKKVEGLGMVLKRIQEVVPKYQRLDHLVKAAEYFEGKKDNGDINVNVVVPILGGKTREVVVESEVEE